MRYQLPSGKVIDISLEQYLDLTDEEIQYLVSINYGEHINNPFSDSAVIEEVPQKHYDFDFISLDEDIENIKNVFPSDEESFDDIIDFTDLPE